MASVKNILVYIAHINDIFQNDKLITDEVDINLYKNKEELMSYFYKKYNIKDCMLIHNREILHNLDSIDDYLILLNSGEIIFNTETSINTNTVNNLFTSIINDLLDSNNQSINPLSNIPPVVPENSELINASVISDEDDYEDVDDYEDGEDDYWEGGDNTNNIVESNPYNLSNLYHNNFSFMNELEQLKLMGFTNIILNKEALSISNGDIDKSVNYILENNY